MKKRDKKLKRVTILNGDDEFEGKVDQYNRKQGIGTFYENGVRIKGNFINDKLEGKVEISFPDG